MSASWTRRDMSNDPPAIHSADRVSSSRISSRAALLRRGSFDAIRDTGDGIFPIRTKPVVIHRTISVAVGSEIDAAWRFNSVGRGTWPDNTTPVKASFAYAIAASANRRRSSKPSRNSPARCAARAIVTARLDTTSAATATAVDASTPSPGMTASVRTSHNPICMPATLAGQHHPKEHHV